MNLWQILALVQARPDVQSLEHEAAHTLVGLLLPLVRPLIGSLVSQEQIDGMIDQVINLIPGPHLWQPPHASA